MNVNVIVYGQAIPSLMTAIDGSTGIKNPIIYAPMDQEVNI